MKGIPVLQVPADDASAGLESVYVFEDGERPYRTATVRISYGSRLGVQELQAKDLLYAGQGSNMLNHVSGKQFKAAGLAELLQKEASGHLRLREFQSWLEYARSSYQDVDDGDGGRAPEQTHAEVAGDEVQFEGVAARAPEPITPHQPSKRRGNDSILRASSSGSVLSVASDAGAQLAGDKAASSIDGTTVADAEEGDWWSVVWL